MTKRPAGTAQTRTAPRTQESSSPITPRPLLAAMALFAAATPTSTTEAVINPARAIGRLARILAALDGPAPMAGATPPAAAAAHACQCRGQDVKVMNLERNKEK